MKCFRILSILNGLLLSSNVAATTPETALFSPYVDLTINTHWDSQTQDMEPMDLAALAQKEHIKSYHLAFITDSGTDRDKACSDKWANPTCSGNNLQTRDYEYLAHLQ